MNKIPVFKSIFLFFIVFCACNNLTKNSSSVILPLDSVVVMVADCFFLEGEIYVKQWQVDLKDYTWIKYDSLFEKRGITKETFVENVKYYSTHKKYAEQFMDKLDTLVEQRVAALRDSLDVKP